MSAAIDPIVDLMGAALAQRHVLDFGRRVYRGFQDPPHIKLIAAELEAVERGEIDTLAVAVAVRHGKSVLCSQVFPAWCIGRHPDWMIGIASHSESLATLHSRVAKSLIEDDRYPWDDIAIATDSSSNQRFHVTSKLRPAGGGLYAVGVNGDITGRGFDILVIDDALHDGLSQSERDNAWKWLTEIAVPRLEPGGRIIHVSARLADDDLIGRLLEAEGMRA